MASPKNAKELAQFLAEWEQARDKFLTDFDKLDKISITPIIRIAIVESFDAGFKAAVGIMAETGIPDLCQKPSS